MRRRTIHFVLAIALGFVAGPGFASAAKIKEVTVGSSRVHVGDVVGGLSKEVADIDLGPAPAAGGSRIIDRDEVVQTLHSHNVDDPPGIPSAIRVLRRTKRLEAADIERMVRAAIGQKLHPGVTLSAVHPTRVVDVPDGWTQITADIPRPARRAGPVSSTANLMFYENSQALWMLSVPVDLMLTREATVPDVAHGALVTVTVRRGLVEVSCTGTAGADADVGSVVPIVLHPSGRTVLARLEDKDHAVALDAP